MTEMDNHSDRAHALLSASSSSRWLKCPPSAVASTLYPSQDTDYTREGTLAHEAAEFFARREFLNGPLDPLGPTEWTLEMICFAEAYRDYIQEQIKSPDAVVLLEQRLDFSPWVPEGFGTGDCLIFQDRELHVIDYKYGRGVPVSAEGNSQMRLYGLGALHDFGDIYEIDEVVLHIFQPRIDNVSVETLTSSELLAWGEGIKPTAEQAYKGEGEHAPGNHCRFCPHAGVCPALAASCLAIYNGMQMANVPALAPEQVSAILEKEAVITAWLKSVKERALAALLDGEEIPGYKVVAGRSTRSWSDDRVVMELLGSAGYSEDKYTETKLLSPNALEKAIGKKKVAELLSDQISLNAGSPTVAPESDKRKPFDRLAEARKDFE